MKLMQYIKRLIFGVKAQGESVPLPSFKTTFPENQPSIDKWVKEVKFGSRYGHKGSFYNNN